ncbi:hypothetical protein NC652_013958 [Populus alba x Populus x berolinensis]|nr:hypothetical protein NC652_013958 [Populus alba x Populus x berolinensis]
MTTESIDLLLVAVKLLRMHNYGVYLNLPVTTIVYVVPAAVFSIRRKIHGGDSLQRHCVFLLNISKEIQLEIT